MLLRPNALTMLESLHSLTATFCVAVAHRISGNTMRWRLWTKRKLDSPSDALLIAKIERSFFGNKWGAVSLIREKGLLKYCPELWRRAIAEALGRDPDDEAAITEQHHKANKSSQSSAQRYRLALSLYRTSLRYVPFSKQLLLEAFTDYGEDALALVDKLTFGDYERYRSFIDEKMIQLYQPLEEMNE